MKKLLGAAAIITVVALGIALLLAVNADSNRQAEAYRQHLSSQK